MNETHKQYINNILLSAIKTTESHKISFTDLMSSIRQHGEYITPTRLDTVLNDLKHRNLIKIENQSKRPFVKYYHLTSKGKFLLSNE